MKLGINEATCMKNSTLERDLVLCEKYGYDYIEIRLDMLYKYLNTHSIEELKAFFEKSRVQPYAFNSIEDINFWSPEQEQKVIELFTFACRMGQLLHVPYIIVVPTVSDEMLNKSDEEIFNDSVRNLKKLLNIAKPYGMKLAFEPIGNKKWCVRTLPQAMEIIDAVGNINLGLALDAFNLYLYNKLKNIDDIDKIPVEKIFVYHINDSEAKPLEVLDHCHRLLPGEGVIPLDIITQKLHKKGYEGIASIETFRPQYWEMNAEDVFKQGSEKTKKYL